MIAWCDGPFEVRDSWIDRQDKNRKHVNELVFGHIDLMPPTYLRCSFQLVAITEYKAGEVGSLMQHSYCTCEYHLSICFE